MVKKCFCLIFVFLFFLMASAQAAGIVETLAARFPEDFLLRMKLSVSEWVPLDEVRCQQLSKLLEHIRMDIAKSGSIYSMGLSVDGSDSVHLYLKEYDDRKEMTLNTLPGTLFEGGENLLDEMLAQESEEVLHHMSFSAGQDLMSLGKIDPGLQILMHSDVLKKTEKKEKQNVAGYGNTSRRVTFDLQDDMPETLSDMLVLSLDPSFFKNASVEKQKLYLLVADDDIIHKASYSCTLNTESGAWKIEASWKNGLKNSTQRSLFKAEASRMREEGERKETIILSCSKESKGQQENMSWQRIHKTGNTQTVRTVSAELMNTDGRITGKCAVRESDQVKGNKGMLIELVPDLLISQEEPYIAGAVTYRYTEDGMNPNAGRIELDVFANDPIHFPETVHHIDLAQLNEEERIACSANVLTSVMSSLLKDLVLIDSADNEYLRQDIPEAEWLKILYTAGPAVEEE